MAFSKISGVFKAAGTAGKGLWAILSANPIGAVVAAVVALVALIRHPLMPVYGEILLKVVSR